MDKTGVATQVASVLLVTAGDNPERLVSEASFARRCVGRAPSMRRRGSRFVTASIRVETARPTLALWRIAFTRMQFDPRTKRYVERRRAEGKTNKEIIHCPEALHRP